MAYPTFIKDPELLKIKTKGEQLKELQYKTEKHDYENILKSLKIDGEYYKKKYKSLNEKKVFMIVSQILFSTAGLTVGSGLTLSWLARVGLFCASSISFLTSVSILNTNKYICKLKKLYTGLGDWIIVITLLYEKTVEQSMIDKEIDKKESLEIRKN